MFPSTVHKKLIVSEKAPTRDLLLAIEISNSNDAVGDERNIMLRLREPDAYLITSRNQHLKQEKNHCKRRALEEK